MTRTAQDLELYLHRLGRPFESTDDTYIVPTGAAATPIVIRVAPPVVLLRADIGPVPSGPPEKEARVFRRLLELNCVDLVHASYGLMGPTMVIIASLELDNLDINELEAALADIDLAIASHVTEIRKLYE